MLTYAASIWAPAPLAEKLTFRPSPCSFDKEGKSSRKFYHPSRTLACRCGDIPASRTHRRSVTEADVDLQFAATVELTGNLRETSLALVLSPDIARTIFIFYSYLKSCVWLLLVAVTLPITSASCERSFS